ncbi:MAG: hypothetical protein ACD_59C00049G0004 [uncultured bacterium]|nr:MAG: hypothetical protein ACD_59C00049G0004 [uncultured bacterium]
MTNKEKETKISNLTNIFKDIFNKLNEYSDKEMLSEIDSFNLNKFIGDFENNSKLLLDDNRKLKIGVIGQVKAGKSSFINSLFFDGKSILPKAATPMTATLTTVSYSNEMKFEIEYYSKSDWAEIVTNANKFEETVKNVLEKIEEENVIETTVDKAKEKIEEIKEEAKKTGYISAIYNLISKIDKPTLKKILTLTPEEKYKKAENLALTLIPEEQKAARELVKKAENNKINLNDKLGTKEIIRDVKNIEELALKIKDFVGTVGCYTPIVKSTYLYVNHPGIKDIEIVDTPGVNDPVVSRGKMTRDFLGKCDVVFVLSFTSSFFDGTDMNLIMQHAPKNGIEHVILIGSKFDSSLIDEAKAKVNNLDEIVQSNRITLENQADKNINEKIKFYNERAIFKNIKNSLPPKFISSILYNISLKFVLYEKKFNHSVSSNLPENQEGFDEDEFNVFKQFKIKFGDDFNADDLKELSYIEEFRKEELKNILERKDSILKERLNNLVHAQKECFADTLKDIREQFEAENKFVANNDINALISSFKNAEKIIEITKVKVHGVYDDHINGKDGIMNKFLDLKEELRKKIWGNKFTEDEGERKEFVERKHWWERNKVVPYNCIFINWLDTREDLEKLIYYIRLEIIDEIRNTVNIDNLKSKLMEAIEEAVKQDENQVDKEMIFSAIKKVCNQINLPNDKDICINYPEYDEELVKRLTQITTEIKKDSNEVAVLKNRWLDKNNEFNQCIEVKLVEFVDRYTQKIKEILDHSLNMEFVDEVLNELKRKKKSLQRSIENKELYIKESGAFIELLKNSENVINNLNVM